MPPIMKSNEEIMKEAIDESVKKASDETVKSVKSYLDEKEKERTEKEKDKGTGSKVSEILKNAKETTEVRKSEPEAKKPEVNVEHNHIHEEISCPTCSSGDTTHPHVLKKTNNGTLKCTGDGCNTEFALVPKDADFKCVTCGLPSKRPVVKELEKSTTCPFCGKDDFIKYDWNKVLTIKKK